MLGYWKWLVVIGYKLSKMLVKWSLSNRKTKFARQIAWLIADFVIIIITVATAILFTGRPVTGFIVAIPELLLIIGHMIYIEETY